MCIYIFFLLLQVKTSFKEFATVVCDDPRSATLDAGNVKLTYNALIEKVGLKLIGIFIVSVGLLFVSSLFVRVKEVVLFL